jgi:hypothetical protein
MKTDRPKPWHFVCYGFHQNFELIVRPHIFTKVSLRQVPSSLTAVVQAKAVKKLRRADREVIMRLPEKAVHA